MELVTIELRGPISGSEYDRVKQLLDENGVNRRHLKRTLIDFSREAKTSHDVEIKLRITNGDVEFIVKSGGFHDPHRQESVVHIEGSELEPLLEALSFLGYTTGVICYRNILKYGYSQLEFSLIEVPDHSYYYEAEIVCERSRAAEAEVTIREILDSLDLEVFTKSEFFDYVESLNIEANELYDHRRDFPLKLK